MIGDIEQISQWFNRLGRQIVRQRWWVLAALAGITLVTGFGLSQIEFDSSSENALLEDDPIMQAGDRFEQIFGNNEYVGVLVEAEDVFAPEILRLIRQLGAELEQRVPYADTVTSLTDFEFIEGTAAGIEIYNLVPDEIPTDPQAIETIRTSAFSKTFLVDRLFSNDSTQTWISLRLRPYETGPNDRKVQNPGDLVGQTVLEILAQEQYRPYTLKPAGVPVFGYQERTFFAQEANTLILLSMLIAILILLLFLRTLQGVIVPLLCFACALIWGFGGMGLLGIKINATVMTLPIYLGLAVSIGYSIHIFNFFRKSFTVRNDRKAAVIDAVQETGWPILFTAATTVSALISFFFVPIRHVRWMGFSSAGVIIAVYLTVMTLTPVLLSFGRNRQHHENQTRTASARFLQALDNRLDHMLIRLSVWIYAHPRRILWIFALTVLIFSGGLINVRVSMNYEDTYGLKIPYVRELHEVGHSRVGSMYAYDMILTFDNPGAAKDPAVLKQFDQLCQEIQQFSLVTRTSSLLDLLKEMHQVFNDHDPAYYTVPENPDMVAQLLLLYEIANGGELETWVDYEYTTLRAMVEVTDFNTAAVEHDVHVIQTLVRTLLPGARLHLVGGLMQISILQNYIARGEVKSSLIALVVIGILMMLVFRSVKTGLIGMIPNIAPVLVVSGLMGYFKIPIDMTTMVVIPILLGLAVDDTIHFITHSQLEFTRTGRYQAAIQNTFRTVGKAIFMTSFILVASFSAYLTSIARFFVHLSILLTAGVISALLADYFVTPVLVQLTKPFGDER